MVVKKTREKEAEEIKKIYRPDLDEIKEIMENTQIEVGDVFSDNTSKDSISPKKNN